MRNIPAGYSYLEARYSGLSRHIARLPFGDFPTPLQPLGKPSERLWVKRDDATHARYGGNKVRKLEYLLGDALQRGHTRVVTFGGVGSNHALATALHAGTAGLDCSCLLMRQRMTDFVETTLQRHQFNETHLLASPLRRSQRVAQLRRLRDEAPHQLSVLPLGGTSPLGCIGYVNAAFELASQWRGEPPQRIYVAAGTMGTAAGLAAGLALLDWPTQVIAVRVTAYSQCNEAAMARLCDKVMRRLHLAEPRIPALAGVANRVTIRHDYLGEDYADVTEASSAAVAAAKQRWSLPLETTYTGKAMACLLDDLASKADSADWLFWHTYNGRAVSASQALNDDYARFLDLCVEAG